MPTDTCGYFKNKKPRFTSLDYTIPSFDVNTLTANGQQEVQNNIQSSCEGQAELWMKALEDCLNSNPSYLQKKDLLRQKLIELCALGGDIDHPSGASTIPADRVSASGYHSFKEVIIGVLGITSVDMLCNPWLLESPYPWEHKPQAVRQTISTINTQTCQKLQQLQQQYTATGSGISFYQYLVNTYGAENVTLTETELAYLLKGCDNCKYLLEKDVPLPVFLESGATGCITQAEWNNAMTAFQNEFATGVLNTGHSNYANILSTYLNHRWGFTLTYDQYKAYEEKLLSQPQIILCNSPVYEPVTQAPYQCFNTLWANAIASGQKDYAAYEEEQKRIFRTNYVNTCLTAKSNARLTIKEQTYHYTLYYYDQSGNLVKTVPPAGVVLLNESQLAQIKDARNFNLEACNYDGPTENTDKNLTLQQLSNTLGATGNHSVEMWLYNSGSGMNQVLAATPDHKFLYQTCLNGNLLNVDIYSLNQTAPDQISFTLSNHATVDVSSLQPLKPWTHVVVQGSTLASGLLQVFVNGRLSPEVAGQPQAGCGWEVSGSNSIIMPENLITIKHLRVYDRMLNAQEIAANAAQPCFALSPAYAGGLRTNLLYWGRFNTPAPGSETTTGEGTTAEYQFPNIYPSHTLVTTYRYNSMGQVFTQNTPDGGTSNFWYDRLGRLVASQNAEQLNPANGGVANRYSYTTYDAFSRIVEVGEKEPTATITLPTAGFLTNTERDNFLASGTNKQVTQTIYDVAASGAGVPAGLQQQNLRKRVVASIYKSLSSDPVAQASYYSYDLAGNVKTLWQQVAGLGIKKIDYQYDLVSGKVNGVAYQHGQEDRYYYQYKYDAENKLLEVLSGPGLEGANPLPTTDGTIKLEGLPTTHPDASYSYYLHGPLARVELGQNKVQGLDYAYTLQGWLKGINGHRLDANTDVGEDGKAGGTFATNGWDALAYSLGYYEGDYQPIGGVNAPAFGVGFTTPATGYGAGLYNGNISHTTVSLSKINNGALTGYTYQYDQLNRIAGMQYHAIGGSAAWDNSTGTVSGLYNETYSYDGNGNIQTLKRNGHKTASPLMDDLTYNYIPGTNQLAYIDDGISETERYDGDVEGQQPGNYTYDRIGNLRSDQSERNMGVNWTVYGKIQSIMKQSFDDNEEALQIDYAYDALGNRVHKQVTYSLAFNMGQKRGTHSYYIRDAQGNVLAVYQSEYQEEWVFDPQTGTKLVRTNTPLTKIEQHLYGSSRLGILRPAVGTGNPTREYELTNHLGNVLATVSDQKIAVPSQTNSSLIDHYEANVISAQDYYPFGMQMPGRAMASTSYRYGFNGHEKDDEIKGEGNHLSFGDYGYDPRTGRRWNVDPEDYEYPSITPYAFSLNTPISTYDPDGKRVYFVGGAGNDQIGWNYVERFRKIWTEKGISGFVRVNASHHVASEISKGKMPWKDIVFTHNFRDSRYKLFNDSPYPFADHKKNSPAIKKTVEAVIKDLANKPLAKGEQFNLTGYSYGAVLQAHVALELVNRGYKIDNLILIGSNISDKSDLYKELLKYQAAGKIGQVIRHDIPGDKLSNPGSEAEFIKGGLQNKDPNNVGQGPHYDLARPDNPATKNVNEQAEADKKIGELADKLKSKGVK